MRSLERCSRLVVIGTPPEQVAGEERVAQRALEGFTRSLGKEVGRGGTAQLVYVADGRRGRGRLDARLPAVAEVGVRLRPGGADRHLGQRRRPSRPTGSVRSRARSPSSPVPPAGSASRSPGCSPATAPPWSGVDVPQAASDLITLTKELGGDYLTLDITAKDAPQRIAQHLTDRARRRRRRGAQRRHHPRQAARQHGRRPLELGPQRQPGRPPADHRRAPRPGARSTTTAGSSASPRSPASPATSGRPTTPPPRPA